jgi:hypothetical protein
MLNGTPVIPSGQRTPNSARMDGGDACQRNFVGHDFVLTCADPKHSVRIVFAAAGGVQLKTPFYLNIMSKGF